MSQLRRAIEDHTPSPLPATLTKDIEVSLEPLVLEGVFRNAVATKEVLIIWKDLPDYVATWEPYRLTELQFPSFHIGDNVAYWEEIIDGLAQLN